jgi:asparagine synthase (glutamine-hydrolysing)
MCGIAGIFDGTRSIQKEDLTESVRRMGERLIHRGPNDSGLWIDEKNGIALAHRRLSIIDLSPAGHQPMVSHCGRYVIIFNGEIYNFPELCRELENEQPDGVAWCGHSDTEVFLTGISQWGVKKALQKSVGMFAFALWDNKIKALTLARDRMGEKPLYYGYAGSTLIFASELKALRAYPKFSAEIERNIIPLYLRHNYIPAPYSIYKGIYKLLPGCFVTIKNGKELSPFPASTYENNNSQICRPIPYWSFDSITQKGREEPFSGTDEEAAEILENLLSEAVKEQMIADVSLGAFLSGGIDSSIVVALMQAHSNRPVKTFSIGFYEKRYNEAEHAKAMAKHLETEHTEFYVTEKEAMSVIPLLPTLYDEPFSDSSQIPTYLLSKLTRNHVSVSLSGDGGDELFCGYSRYFSGCRLWKMVGWMPSFLRTALSQTLLDMPEFFLDRTFFWLSPLLKKYGDSDSNAGYNLSRVAEVIGVNDSIEFYQASRSHWKKPLLILAKGDQVLKELPYRFTQKNDFYGKLLNSPILRQMMMLDGLTYLPDDILVKVDRAAMAVSLESRMPLLDHRVVEFAASLPHTMNYRNGMGKQSLRRVLYRYVPKQLVERPKMGFGIPLEHWLRGHLREWAESLLDVSRLRREGYFHPEPIRQKWQEHLSGKRNWHYELWDVLMFQAWLEHGG